MEQSLWHGGPLLSESPDVFPLGTDSLLLADFARPADNAKILDLGTGCGILPLLLLWSRPRTSAAALDISPAACALARENFRQNGLSGRTSVLEGSLRDFRHLLSAGGYDMTVSNPPYFPQSSGPAATVRPGDARKEESCSLEDLCAAAAWATRYGGSFCLVYRPERLGELFAALQGSGFTPKRIRPVHHSPGLPVNLFLTEARRGGGPGIAWEPDLYLCGPDGSPSQEYRRICHLL